MSDLKLVAPDQPTPLEQRLLDAVVHEAPSAEQRARVRLALGLPAVATAPLPTPPVGRRALLLKAAAGAALVSAVMVAWFASRARHEHAEPSAARTAQAPAPSAPIAASAAPSAPAPSAPEAVIASAPSAAREELLPSKRASKPTAVDRGADLSEELRLIDAARSAIAGRNAAAAAAALSSYRARFPRGTFAQEATVLQIETLDLQGNHTQAAAQARSFLARHPNSPHVNAVQRIAGSGG